MNGNGKRDRMATPLAGAVLCCTSVLPEQRTRYAEFALQMGAEHKLDLTSDVTHLLVGDTNTPKYRYVAREREDVKVVRPEWVEAVREAWMNDEEINLNALEEKYRLPTFAGLNICITGFDDLTFRAQLQKAVNDDGGNYAGDLTKAVSHLIAAKPEGKKYQYATQWQMKVVSLKWLKDSRDRGMQLDESLYHPSIPGEEQGKGAWNREAKMLNHTGKRPRAQEIVAEPSRKLRRTASAKLSSQHENLWGDIVGGGGFETAECEGLRPSKSMPAIRPVVQEAESFAKDSSLAGDKLPVHERPPGVASVGHGFLDGKHFCLEAFDSRKSSVLEQVLLSNGAVVLQSLDEMYDLRHLLPTNCFLVVPHDRSTENLQKLSRGGRLQVVTELWVEICMIKKQYVDHVDYPLGGLLPKLPLSDSNDLSVNSSGFPGIERLHIAKAVQAMGARYDEVLKPGISVLICHAAGSGVDKMRHARKWRIPVVSVSWLWDCARSGRLEPFQQHLIGQSTCGDTQPIEELLERTERQCESRTLEREGQEQKGERKESKRDTPYVPTQMLPKKLVPKDVATKLRPGSDFLGDERAVSLTEQRGRNADVSTDVDAFNGMPLQEMSENCPGKSRSTSPKKKTALFRTLDGGSSISEMKEAEVILPGEPLRTGEAEKSVQHAQQLNGAIQDLLNQSAKAKSATSSVGDAPPAKKKLLGRALSNLSNSSMGSRARVSRAGSVDSVNTDGVGSEILIDPSEREGSRPRSGSMGGRGSNSFTGRAKPKEATQKGSSIELGGPGLYQEVYAEEEIAPPLTQLGYEDPEEAIMLRAKLAEKRRKKTRIGQEQGEPVESVAEMKQERRIRDDHALLDGGVGWGAGRRTRPKDRCPPGLKDF